VSEMCSLALGPTWPSIHCVLGHFCSGVGWLQWEADHTLIKFQG